MIFIYQYYRLLRNAQSAMLCISLVVKTQMMFRCIHVLLMFQGHNSGDMYSCIIDVSMQ
jgi:hypothetical protein